MIYIVTNKHVDSLLPSNGHDLRIIKLLESNKIKLINAGDEVDEINTVVDIPGLGLRDYFKLCFSSKKIFRNIFLQDSFFKFQYTKLFFLIKSNQITKISFLEIFNLLRAFFREIFFYMICRNIGFVSNDDTYNFKNVVVIPNGTSIKNINLDFSFDNTKRFVFWGSLDYPPNFDSIFYFIKNHWENISISFPDYKFEIYGKISPIKKNILIELLSELNIDNVIIVGPFNSLVEVVKDSIFLNCVQYGSGIKNKTLESISLGVPQICTNNSISGLNINPILSYDLFVSNPLILSDNTYSSLIYTYPILSWDESCDLYITNMVK